MDRISNHLQSILGSVSVRVCQTKPSARARPKVAAKHSTRPKRSSLMTMVIRVPSEDTALVSVLDPSVTL